jgi:hypothetical protein
MSTFAITPVLKQAVEHRIEGLEHAKKSFKRRYHLDTHRSTGPDVAVRISKLLEDVEKFDPELEDGVEELTSETIKMFIGQAQDDKSISETRLLDLEKRLQNKLSKHLNRLEVSYLHVHLMREAMNADVSIAKTAAKLETPSVDDDFEIVDQELQELVEELKKDVLTPIDVDCEAIQAYLSSMLTGHDEGIHLQAIRDKMQAYGNELANDNMEIDQDGVTWAITDLITNDFVCQRTKATLGAYLQSPIALQELVATLKMKTFRDYIHNDAETGSSITLRRNDSGQYSVAVDEDIIDMLFLHCTAIGWASNLKDCSKGPPSKMSMNFSASKPLAQSDLDKRSYFLCPWMPKNDLHTMCYPMNPSGPPLPPPPPMPLPFVPYSMNPHALMQPCVPYVMTPPPPLPSTNTFFRKKARKERWQSPMAPPPLQPPQPMFGELDSERKKNYMHDFFMWRLPKHYGRTPKVLPLEDVQANLLKILAVELTLQTAFGGDTHVSARKFDSLASSIPHKTIIAVLKFLGVPKACLHFFTLVLETKVNLGSDKAFKCTRGVSARHGMEMLFSEAVLFFLELAVHQKTGSFLYRLYDRCYLVGTYEQVKAANEEMTQFCEIMGLKMHDDCANGKLSIGFLTVDLQPSSPKGTTTTFKIDGDKVTAYAYRMKKTLGACSTVIEWVNTWNDTAGTYAAHLFGPLADVFGKPHLEAVKAAYNHIFSIIFDGSDLTTHVKTLLDPHIKGHFINSPLALDPFIYLPQSHGGLGVKNPFVVFSLAHKIHENPFAEIEKYLAEEDIYYSSAAQSYALLTPEQRQQKLVDIFGNDASRITTAFDLNPNCDPIPPIPFITKEDLFKDRARAAYPNNSFMSAPPSLVTLYHKLLNEPRDYLRLPYAERVGSNLGRRSRRRRVQLLQHDRLSAEDQWVLKMYSEECIERYGTTKIWWAEGVPVGVYEALRGKNASGGYDTDSDESV